MFSEGMTRRASLFLLLVAMGTIIAGAQSVHGQGTITFGIRPANGSPDDAGGGAYFSLSLAPGESSVEQALILNTGTGAVDLHVYVADAITATGGGTAFAARGEEVSGASRLIDLPSAELSIPPNENITLSFDVSVPPGTPPGDYVAGLVAEAPPKSGTSSGVQTQLVERAGVAIVVRVPGEVKQQLAFGQFCLNQFRGSNYFEIPVSNDGNVLASAEGTFRFETADGQHVFERPTSLRSVMPGGQTVLRVHAPDFPPPGAYVARLAMDLSDGTLAATDTEMLVPEERVDGCARESGVAGANDAGSGDNFNVQPPSGGTSDLAANGNSSGGTPAWPIIVSIVLFLALAGALVVIFFQRRPARS